MSLLTKWLPGLCLPALVFLLSGCRQLVRAPLPENEMSIGAVFGSDADAQQAMAGVYVTMMNNSRAAFNGGISLDAGLSADELYCTQPYAPEDSFQLFKLPPSNMQNTRIFNTIYELVYFLNTMLAGLPGSSGVSAPVKARLEGEVLFNRALLYFYLVNLYGGVPIALTPKYMTNTSLQRASADSVNARVIADLQKAVLLLPEEYISDASDPGARTRPNQAAAKALLARVWLYRGQWDSAEAAAANVIGDPRYQLESDPDSVFLSRSREAIWQLQPVYEDKATADGYAYLKPAPIGRPLYVLTTDLLGSMEAGDERKLHWTHSLVYKGQVLVCPFKYKLLADTGTAMEYEMVLRLAEQYLIRAEARARQGELSGAISDVNVIRARAGLAPTPAMTQTDILDAIAHERRIELFTEWGHRWLDLKRTGQATTVLQTKTGWDPHDSLYPIPAAELLANPGMPQNPGY